MATVAGRSESEVDAVTQERTDEAVVRNDETLLRQSFMDIWTADNDYHAQGIAADALAALDRLLARNAELERERDRFKSEAEGRRHWTEKTMPFVKATQRRHKTQRYRLRRTIRRVKEATNAQIVEVCDAAELLLEALDADAQPFTSRPRLEAAIAKARYFTRTAAPISKEPEGAEK